MCCLCSAVAVEGEAISVDVLEGQVVVVAHVLQDAGGGVSEGPSPAG